MTKIFHLVIVLVWFLGYVEWGDREREQVKQKNSEEDGLIKLCSESDRITSVENCRKSMGIKR